MRQLLCPVVMGLLRRMKRSTQVILSVKLQGDMLEREGERERGGEREREGERGRPLSN
jgi:hypothetical protein